MMTVHIEIRSHKTVYNTLYEKRLCGWEVIRNLGGKADSSTRTSGKKLQKLSSSASVVLLGFWKFFCGR